MNSNERRILTTHTGSLPRAPRLPELLIRQETGEPYDRDEFDRLVEDGVTDVIARQLGAGIDIGNDGEQPQVVANRIIQVAEAVGDPERVIAGMDCNRE